MNLAQNLTFIRSRIGSATLVAATKYVGADVIAELVGRGVADIGENRIDAFLEKKRALAGLAIRWHFIGHLQSNKAEAVIEEIDVLHSLDSLRLAAGIQKRRTTVLPCFVEVNVSGESRKNGVAPEALDEFVRELAKYDKIRMVGLMGMAAVSTDPAPIEASFRLLARLRDGIRDRRLPYAPCAFLSMGMSADYEIAVRCGATHVRIGSILFGSEAER